MTREGISDSAEEKRGASTNLIEVIDKVLFDVARELPEKSSDRASLIVSSLKFREWARRAHHLFTIERVKRLLQGEPSSLEDIYPKLFTDGLRSPLSRSFILEDVSAQCAERVLQAVGLLGPEEALDTLKNSDRWSHPSHGTSGTVRSSIKAGGVGVELPSSISGVGVGVIKKEIFKGAGQFDYPYEIRLTFMGDAVKTPLENEPRNSLFQPQLPT